MANTLSNNTTHNTADRRTKTISFSLNYSDLPGSQHRAEPKRKHSLFSQKVVAAALSSLAVRLFPGEQVEVFLENQHIATPAILPTHTLNQVFTQFQTPNLSSLADCAKLDLHQQRTHLDVTLTIDPLFWSPLLQSWFTAHVTGYIHRVVSQPDLALNQIFLLSQEQRDDINQRLHPGMNNQSATENPKAQHQIQPGSHGNLLHQYFTGQVAFHPNSVALDFAGETLSYQALDELSNNLKHKLLDCYHAADPATDSAANTRDDTRAEYVAPDTRIALIFERSPAWFISILAVLKAGGAYVPLDPAYPASRLHYMLQDSGAQLVLGSTEWLKQLRTSRRINHSNHLKQTHPKQTSAEHQEIVPWADLQPVAENAQAPEHQWLQGIGIQVLPPQSNTKTSTKTSTKISTKTDTSTSSEPAQHSSNNHPPTGNNLAYVIYTSGSTGKPKGVAVEHQGACALAEDLRLRFALKPGVRMLQFASPSFDASVFEWAGALCSGATLVVAASSELPPQQDIADTLSARHIHIAMLPPSVIRTMKNRPLPTLQWLLSGGEPCTSDIVQKWHNNAELNRPLVNVYGPTEATVLTSAAYLLPNQPIHIGTAIADRRVAIVNSWQEQVPAGATGELCILGCGVAREYLNAPPAAVNFFTASQISGFENSAGYHDCHDSHEHRGYRTGDYVRQSPEDHIEYIGRRDKQIKVRGYRIELGEIEAAIIAHPKVKETAVVLCKQEKTNFIVAFVCGAFVCEASENANAANDISQDNNHSLEQDLTAELIQKLNEQLPSHMLPQRFYFPETLPLTPNGKIDRDALVAMAQTDTTPPPDHLEEKLENNLENTAEENIVADVAQQSHNTYQQTLLAIWRDVLGQPHITANDNFYALGGDSIIAIQVISALETQGLALNASDFVANPSIRELARYVTSKDSLPETLPESSLPETNASSLPDISQQNISQPDIAQIKTAQPFNLSPIQQWLYEQNPAAIQGFCQYQTLRIRQFNAERFTRALNNLVQQHDAFRQCFVAENTATPPRWQRVYQAEAPEIVLEPLVPINQSGSTVRSLEKTAEKAVENWFTQFSPETGQFVKAASLDMNKEQSPETLVLIAIHHLVIDGVSWRLLLNQLQKLYWQPEMRISATVPQVAIQQALQRYADHPDTFAQLAHWQSVLSQSAQIYNHNDWVVNPQRIHQPLQHLALSTPLHTLNEGTSNNLQLLPLLGAFALSFQQLTNTNHVAFVTEGHGREPHTNVNFERNIGWFTSMFPVCFHLPTPLNGNDAANPEKWERLQESWQQLQQQWYSVPDNGLSYGALRYLNADAKPGFTRPGSQKSPLTLPPVVFNFLGVFHHHHDENWVAFDAQSGQDSTPHPLGHSVLELNCAVVNGTLVCRFSYHTALFEPSRIEQFHACFLQFAAALVQLNRNENSDENAVKNNNESKRTDSGRTFGLTATQQGMLFHTLSHPQLDNYLVQTLWHYPCDINPEAMEHSWQQASEQQAVFRTAYEWHNRASSPQQRLCEHSDFGFHWHNIRHLTSQQQQQEIARIIEQDRAQPFDLSKPGSLRAHWFALGEQQHQLLFSHHHILLDGWSLSLLLNAIDHLYQQQISNNEVPAFQSPPSNEQVPNEQVPNVQAPNIQAFIDFAQRQNFTEAKAFFARLLAQGDISSRLPVQGVAKSLNELKPITNQRTQQQELNASVTASLATAAKQHGVTLGALILLAAGLVQSANDNGANTVFGTILSGRNHLPELTNTPGMLASTLPVIFRPNWQQSMPQALQAMHVLLGELNRHSLLPLRDIHNKHSGKPVSFSSLITFENYPGQESGLNSESHSKTNKAIALVSEKRTLLQEIEKTAYPLTLVFRPFQGKLESKISYDADVFSESDISVLQQQLSCVLWVIAEHANNLNSLTCEMLAAKIGKQPNDTGHYSQPGHKRPRYQQPDHQQTEKENDSDNMAPTKESTHSLETEPASQMQIAQKALETAWKEVLGVASVGLQDNYFSLGGDSLNALQIMNALEQQGYRLSAPDVLQNPEFKQMLQLLADQAPALTGQSPNENQAVAHSIAHTITRKPYPLAPTQLRFFNRYFKGELINPHFFTIPVFSQLKQAVTTTHLTHAIDAALAVSDGHHVKFTKGDGIASIRQTPHRWLPDDYLRVVDLSENQTRDESSNLVPQERPQPISQEKQQQIIQQVAEDASQSMNIWHGALFRIVAFTNLHQPEHSSSETENGSLLFIVFHHLVSDGMSVNVFLQRLSTMLMEPEEQHRPQKRSLDTLQPGYFLPWADALHHYASVHDWRVARHEWQRIMAGSSNDSAKLAASHQPNRAMPSPCHAEMSVFEQPLLATPAASAALRITAQRLKTTPFNLLLAIFLLALQRIDRHRSSLHIMGAQRHIPPGLQTEQAYMGDLNQCMGFFSAAVPFTGSIAQYLDSNPHHQIAALLPAISQRHQRCNERALEYLILQYLLPASNPSNVAMNEQQEMLFHYFAADPREQENSALAPAQFASGPASDPQNQSNYLLNTTLIHTENELRCRFYYASDFISEAELVQIHADFTTSIAALQHELETQTPQASDPHHQESTTTRAPNHENY